MQKELSRVLNYGRNLAARVTGLSAYKEGWDYYRRTYHDESLIGADASGSTSFFYKWMFPAAYNTLRDCGGVSTKLSPGERLKLDGKMLLDFFGGAVIPLGLGIAERNLASAVEARIAYQTLVEIVPDVLRSIRGRISPTSTILA